MKRAIGPTRQKPSRVARPKASAKARRSAKPKAPRVRLEVDERRAQLVNLGLTEFGSRTYDEVSIDLIAQAAGISKGLLYHYFPTKRAFYVGCIREAAKRLLDRLAQVPSDATPFDRLKHGLEAYLEYVRAHGRAYATLMRNSVGLGPEIASVVDQTRTTLLDGVTGSMANLFPGAGATPPPLLQLALHGWIGFAEAMSIAWVEACVEADPRATTPPPTASDVRDLLAKMLIAAVEQSVVR